MTTTTFKTRAFLPEDYATYKNWLDQRRRPCPELEHLPALGVVVEANDTPAAIGFLSSTNIDQCAMHSLASNPLISDEIRGGAVESLIDSLIAFAQDGGFKTIFASANRQKFLKRLEDRGFQAMDVGITQMGREL